MRYKAFGNTGMEVSEMSLGSWGIGGAGWDDHTEEERLDAIHAAVECGINFIDTAPAYNAGVAEQYVGKALKEMGSRDKVAVATKCGTFRINDRYVRNNAPDAVIGQCEESLRNLQTDYIDLYLVHWPDAKVPIQETMEALVKLKEQGKILHIGVCNFSPEEILEAEQVCPVEAYQLQYSMVMRSAQSALQWAADRGMGVMTYGSLGGGILTGRYRQLTGFAEDDNRNRFYQHFKEPMFSRIMELLKVMDVMAAEKDVSLSQIALNWSSQRPFISTCIVGAQKRSRILQNTAAYDWQLSKEEAALLDAAIGKYLGCEDENGFLEQPKDVIR